MKIVNVVGARPNFIKITPILRAMKKYPRIKPLLVHTGQHYDYNMSDRFFKDLKIPKPNIYLGVGSGSHAEQTAGVMAKFEKILLREKPDLVLVVGDVNSTLACTLAASKLHIKVAHVEAGMRSFDRSMPEEINRIVTDRLSDYLFITSLSDRSNLLKEGIDKNRIFLVGNVMADTLLHYAHFASLKPDKIYDHDYAVLTLHRQENVDYPARLKAIFKIIHRISKKITVFFPVHPRTRKQMKRLNLTSCMGKNVKILEPLGYLDFLRLYAKAKFVLTDSGGLQAETTLLHVPCLTLRDTTEWPVTISKGTNVLVKVNEKKIVEEVNKILEGKQRRSQQIPCWDGKAAERIVKVLSKLKPYKVS